MADRARLVLERRLVAAGVGTGRRLRRHLARA
jgi:hypothetical protein